MPPTARRAPMPLPPHRKFAVKPDSESVCFAADGKSILTGGGFEGVHRWTLGGKHLREYLQDKDPHLSVNWEVAGTGDGKYVIAGFGDLSLWLWNAKTAARVTKLAGHGGIVTSVSVAGTRALTGAPNKEVKLWELPSGRELATVKFKKAATWRVALSPDGKTGASGGADKFVHLLDLARGVEVAALDGHASWVDSLAFSHDGRLLATASRDKTVRIWDVAKRRQRGCLTGHKKQATGVRFSSTGELASCDRDGTVRIWDVKANRERVLLGVPGVPLAGIAYGPNGKLLAAVAGDTVYLWDR